MNKVIKMIMFFDEHLDGLRSTSRSATEGN